MANYVITSGSNSFTFEVDGKKAEYGSRDLIPSTPDGAGNVLRIKDTTRNLTTVAFIENEALKIDLAVDTVNVDGTTVWADADALLNALKPIFFFSISGTGGWNGEVDTRNDLPLTNPPTIGQVYLVRNPVTSTILGIPYRTYQSGLYIKDTDTGSLSDWRRLNVKVQFTTSEFRLADPANTSKQLQFNIVNQAVGVVRSLFTQDKDMTIADAAITIQGENSVQGGGSLLADRLLSLINDVLSPAASSVYGVDPTSVKGWHQLVSLVTNNAGQIKLNWTVGTRPESPSGFTGGVPQSIGLNTNYTVSGSPTTTYPFLADSGIGGQNVIDNVTLFLRELLAGQTILFRVKVGYINKGAGQNGNVIVRMFNPNPASTFVVPKSIPTPDGTNAYEEEFEFIAIADGLSLDPLYGYAFEAETTFNDGNLVVYIQEITAFYIGKDLFNKT